MNDYRDVQARELGYWVHTPWPPERPWWHYDRKFLPYLSPATIAIDVGCGPVPYLLNHNVRYDAGYAVDPLIFKYLALDRYKMQWCLYGQKIKPMDDLGDIRIKADMVFLLNVIDHVRDPSLFIDQVAYKTAKEGRVFVYVDIEKEPDDLHPHKISREWLSQKLFHYFDTIYQHIEKSWKFSNPVFWYVGTRRE